MWSMPTIPNDQAVRSSQAQWREQLGIEVTWQMFDWYDYMQRMAAHPPNLFTMAWVADYPDPDSFLRVALHQPYHHWRHTPYEQLLDAARRINDPVERLKFYQAADRLLMQEAAIMPLTHGQWHLLITSWVKRHPLSALKDTYWKDVIMEAH